MRLSGVLRTLMALSCLVIGVGHRSLASTDSERETLKGLPGVHIIVEGLESDVEAAGLREQDIQNDVELKLRSAGIKILTLVESLMTAGSPYLYVHTTIYSRDASLYFFSVSVRLNQTVTLASGNEAIGVPTWERSNVGSVGRDKIRHIRDAINDYVTEFANDYLTANPK